MVAFVPALALSRDAPRTPVPSEQRSTWASFRKDLFQAFQNPILLALGIVEAIMYLGLRANKAFLPAYSISVGINPAQIGVIFSVQVGATLLAQPIGGSLSDRWGRKPVIGVGLLLIAGTLPLMVMTESFLVLVVLGAVLGLGEAAIMPSIVTLGTEQSKESNYGSTMGMLDAMDNVGKALGPIVAGLLLVVFGYFTSFTILAGILLAAAVVFWALVPDIG
jgi:MFS family permease